MNEALLPFIAFVAIGSILMLIFLLLRDLFGGRAEEPQRIERLPGAEGKPDGGLAARFDAWFNRLTREAAFPFTPTAAFLLALAVGLVVGGSLYLWRNDLLVAALGMCSGMLAVFGIYTWMRARRLRKMQEELPDAIELLARAVRAGESLDQAIGLVGQTVPAPLGPEFQRCAHQLELGLAMGGAMRSFATQVPIQEAKILASTLSVQRRTGGSLPRTLQRLAQVIRDRLNYRRQFRAATAAGRSSTLVMTVAAILVALYLLIGRPEYLHQFIESFAGRILLAIAVLLQLIGLVWISRLLRPDY